MKRDEFVTLKSSVLLLWLCTGFLICVGGCSVGPRILVEKEIEMKHPLAAGSIVDAETSSGSITVEGIDTHECHVVAKIRVRAKTQALAAEIAEQIEILITPTASGLEIRAEKPKRSHVSISISYDITVPNRSSIVCGSSSGSLKVIDIEGDVNARTSSGSVRCENLVGDTATLGTSSGSVHLKGATFSTCQLRTSSGSIHVDQINCPDIKASVSSGSITIVCTQTSLPELKADLQTSSGSVNLTVPQAYKGRVDLSTSSGSIRTDFPVAVQGKISKKHLVGTVGSGAGTIRLKSSSGSVRLKSN
ncbi:MAG: DUF4097 domain-containing protein [Planctomycetes bacterium]|nr:DUF4097 domain-containing protein [Planctomycetota bacterium]